MIIIISLPPHPSVVKSSLSSLRLSNGQSPYVHIWHLTTTVACQFCQQASVICIYKYILTETTRGIHFSEDWNGVSRKTLGITYAVIFKTNLGSPILEYWSEHYPHPLSLLLASCSCWPNVVTDTKLLLSPRSTMSQKGDSNYKVAEKKSSNYYSL